jgi:hypothetical protein
MKHARRPTETASDQHNDYGRCSIAMNLPHAFDLFMMWRSWGGFLINPSAASDTSVQEWQRAIDVWLACETVVAN